MTVYQRQVNLPTLLKKKSFFLLSPRATGKSFLIKTQLMNQAIIIDLLRSNLYLTLSAAPWELENIINAELEQLKTNFIVIDEIQKIPALLDEVHRLIENRGFHFLLTGSSARKLKRGHANLLAGRARTAALFPLSFSEITDFNLERYLQYGGLPAVYSSDEPEEELNAYVKTYLYEEIQAESLVRKLPQFSRFLITAALTNGKLLNFAKIASDTAIPASTVKDYYSLLEDTLIGFQLFPWIKSKKRKAIETARFYLFDIGVTHTMAQTKILDRNSDLYGRSFEHWIAMELRSYLSYRRSEESLSFWRTTHNQEVDFIIGDHTAIEVKASKRMNDFDLKGLKTLQEEKVLKTMYLISQDPIEKKVGNITCLYWETFMNRLWNDELFQS